MGQALSDALGDSPPPHDTLDPGPLSDAELAEALKRFAEHATDGALAQGAFDAIAEDKQDDFAAAARHASFYDAARRGAPTVDAQAFVAFCGVATRGSRSRRLEHVVTAGLGVRTLSDACDAAQTKRLAALMFSLVGAETSPAVALSAAAAAGPSKPIAASDASPGFGGGAGGSGTDGTGAGSTSMAEAGGTSSSIAAGTDGAGADTAGAHGLHTPKRRRSAAAALATRCSAASTAGGGGGATTGASGNMETAFATKAADARSPPCRAPLPASEASSRATVSFVEASANDRCRPAALRVSARCSARTSA